MLDWLINGAVVADGGGGEPRALNVGIKGDLIAYVGKDRPGALQMIEGKGLVLAPGFIDTHTHSEFSLLADGRAEGKVCQGVTTEINGNCGLSAAPLLGEAAKRREADQREYGIAERWGSFSEYCAMLKQKGMALNFASLCGQGNIRASVMGYVEGPADARQVEEMRALLAEALQAGCLGLSTGLIYPPGVFTPTEELVTLVRDIPCDRRLYATHMRNEGDQLVESVEEALKIGFETGAAVHLSHLKTAGEGNWHKIDQVIGLIEGARSSGLRVTADRYPYIASSTDLDTILPAWVHEGGIEQELARLRTASVRETLRRGLAVREPAWWEGILVSSVGREHNRWMEGLSIAAIAERSGRHPAEAALDIILDEEARAGAIFFSMSEENLRRFLTLPYMMIGSDSSVRSFSGVTRTGKPHPRGFGSFPRFIGKYVRDERLLPLGEAVRRMTSLPATVFGLGKRGLVREGYFADLALFDYETISDGATFEDPFRKPAGVRYVFVNGRLTVREGEPLDVRPGRIIA